MTDATLLVNGRIEALPEHFTVSALLVRLGLGRDGIAVAVNGVVVPKSAHDDHALCPGDRVEVIQAVGGG